jgi:hypothetical protein
MNISAMAYNETVHRKKKQKRSQRDSNPGLVFITLKGKPLHQQLLLLRRGPIPKLEKAKGKKRAPGAPTGSSSAPPLCGRRGKAQAQAGASVEQGQQSL